MKINAMQLLVGILALGSSIWMYTTSKKETITFSEQVKVTLRDVGHQLLLSNQDSTSLILPVVKIAKSKYSISFQSKLAFEPSKLIEIVQSRFNKGRFPKKYLVSVIDCNTDKTAYSYLMDYDEAAAIIPCKRRLLPNNCYTIEVKFSTKNTLFNISKLIFIIPLGVFFFLIFYKQNKKNNNNTSHIAGNYSTIGSLNFYPKEHKLIKDAVEIALSKKECEILLIFIDRPNQIIKRKELIKKVWEDNGVVVGRSLDTYISKLRKKLAIDPSIKLTNIHGVGYKLEV